MRDLFKHCLVLTFAISGLTVPPAAAATPNTYYVDAAAGNDTNTGTSPATAWKTLGRVNQGNYLAGDTIALKGGQSFSSTALPPDPARQFGALQFTAANAHGTAANPVTLTSYGAGRATIKGYVNGASHAIAISNVGGWKITNLNLVGAPTLGHCAAEINAGPLSEGILFNNDDDNKVQLSHFYVSNVEVSGFCHGIFMVDSQLDDANIFQDVRFDRVVAHDNGDGIAVLGFVDYATSRYAVHDLYVGHSQLYRNRGGFNPVFQSGAGVYVFGVDRMTVEYNTAWENGGNNPNAPGNFFNFVLYADDAKVQFNEAMRQRMPASVGRDLNTVQTDAGGFNLYGNNGLVQYNYSHGNDGIGFLFDSGSFDANPPFNRNGVVRYNISENDGQVTGDGNLYISGSLTNWSIYNNVFYAKGADPLGNGVGAGPALHLQNPLADPSHPLTASLYNNLFVADGVPLARFELDETNPASATGIVMQRNDWWAADGKFRIEWGGGFPVQPATTHTYTSLSSWSSATGMERSGGSLIGLSVDPLLCAGGTGGDVYPAALSTFTAYRLRPASPLVDQALDLTAPPRSLVVGIRDFSGDPIPSGAAYDVGAEERQPVETC